MNHTPTTVNSYNEWDPLEEAIVGVVGGSTIPQWHVTLEATMPKKYWSLFRQNGGKLFPEGQITAAKKELDEFCRLLESEGVTVRRPDIIPFNKPYSSPEWTSHGGLYAAMPRDILLVIGNEIIESPMAWRSRYFEIEAYRSLLKDYLAKGAKWSSAPKPLLGDKLYNDAYGKNQSQEELEYAITEHEPVFDAADFIRCGRDIFVQQSNVTNQLGIEWLQRHLGSTYRIHTLKFEDKHPMHIDATFMPLAPGKLLINPERVRQIPSMFKGWDILTAPRPSIPDEHPLYFTSKWVSINVLMLDEERVIVEKNELPLIHSFKSWGFKVIPCSFRNFNTFGGSFHCATVDIRRRGTLQSYFD
jgi:glycine amidinotransferase